MPEDTIIRLNQHILERHGKIRGLTGPTLVDIIDCYLGQYNKLQQQDLSEISQVAQIKDRVDVVNNIQAIRREILMTDNRSQIPPPLLDSIIRKTLTKPNKPRADYRTVESYRKRLIARRHITIGIGGFYNLNQDWLNDAASKTTPEKEEDESEEVTSETDITTQQIPSLIKKPANLTPVTVESILREARESEQV